MSLTDLSFIDTARRIEVEAIEGGRALSEFTLDPESGGNDEEVRVHGKAIDDIEEGAERRRVLQEYVPHARSAFQQRGLTYPFHVSGADDSLEVLPGHDETARVVADLGLKPLLVEDLVDAGQRPKAERHGEARDAGRPDDGVPLRRPVEGRRRVVEAPRALAGKLGR